MAKQKNTKEFQSLSSFFVLLICIFAVAPFYYHPNIGGTALNLPSNIVVWFFACLFLWLTFGKIFKSETLVKPRLLVLIIAFPILATISGFVTGVEQPMEWLFRLIFIWGGVLFLIALLQYPELENKTDMIFLIVVISGLIHALVAAIQILQPEGMSIILPRTPEGNRPTGMFLQVNNQASYQATVLIISFFLATRPILQSKHWLLVTLSAVATGAFIIASSGSRVGALGLIVGLLLLLVFRYREIKSHFKPVALMFAIALVGFGLGGLTQGFDHLVNKSTAHTEYSSGERVVIYSIVAELIEQKPLFGHGIGSFPGKWQYQKAEYLEQNPDVTFEHQYVEHPHNELLFWQVEGGVLATLGILISTFVLIYLLWRNHSLYLLALLFPFALHLQVELPFYLSAPHWLLFLLLIAIGLAQGKPERSELGVSDYMHTMLKSLNHVIFLVAIVFLSHSMLANIQLSDVRKGGSLATAKVNPYFNKIAEELYMQQVYLASMDARSKDGLRYYLKWAEEAVEFRPVVPTFLFMMSSYQTLGLAKQACMTAEIASGIYPEHQQIRDFYLACSADQ